MGAITVRKRDSRATKLSAVVLARQVGVDAAVEAFGVDGRTVRGWQANLEVTDDAWTAIRDVATGPHGGAGRAGKTSGRATGIARGPCGRPC